MTHILNKPETMCIAQRMMSDNAKLILHSCNAHQCWLCLLDSPFVCQDMHWACILLHLASEVPSSNKDLTMTCPRFCLLPSLVQKNVLVLLSRCSESTFLSAAVEFLNSLRTITHCDLWIHFLLSKFTRLYKESKRDRKSHMCLQDSESSETVHVALTDTLIGKIHDLGRRFSALEPVTCTGVSANISAIDVNMIRDMTAHEEEKVIAPSYIPNQGNNILAVHSVLN